MRYLGFVSLVVAVVGMPSVAMMGCGLSSECEDTGTCGTYTPNEGTGGSDASVGGSGGSSGGGGTSGSGGSGHGGGGTGGVGGAGGEGGTGCDVSKSPGEEGCLIADEYGVFVSPDGTDGDSCGTQAAPCKTITGGLTALAAGTRKNLYVCADKGEYDEQVSVSADGLGLYGGFHCDGWAYDQATRARIKPSSEGVAVAVSGVTGLVVENFVVEGKSATTAGASSLAVIVASSQQVVLRRVDVTAGNGALGSNGSPGTQGANGAEAGADQIGKAATCTDAGTGQLGGAWPGYSGCGSLGGNGGAASNSSGGSGVDGEPLANTNQGAGSSVLGATAASGTEGAAGGNGPAGTAPGAIGVFSATGYAPADGPDGTDGSPGQGGGGGGASKASSGCVGASGGAGGMGGCGGTKGTGGRGGGASVAVLSWDSTVTLSDCVLTTGTGGGGGTGGPGGARGVGKDGATGGTPWGSMGGGGHGGPGGNGGLGGSGSGGTGGASIAVVYKGTKPAEEGTVSYLPGEGGPKGTAGEVEGIKAADGLSGMKAETYPVP